MIRILVAAARPTARAGLAAVARSSGEVEVVGQAAGASDLLALAAAHAPDVALLELEGSGDDLGSAIPSLVRDAPETGILVICDADSAWIAGVVRDGVNGVLPRDAESAEIAAAVRATAEGLLVLPAATARALLPTGAPSAPIAAATGAEALTARELEVLRLLSEGLGNKEIARRLQISEHTVKFHVGAVMAKLGASSRTEAVTLSARRGLIML